MHCNKYNFRKCNYLCQRFFLSLGKKFVMGCDVTLYEIISHTKDIHDTSVNSSVLGSGLA